MLFGASVLSFCREQRHVTAYCSWCLGWYRAGEGKPGNFINTICCPSENDARVAK